MTIIYIIVKQFIDEKLSEQMGSVTPSVPGLNKQQGVCHAMPGTGQPLLGR